jgi:hypothetical protein
MTKSLEINMWETTKHELASWFESNDNGEFTYEFVKSQIGSFQRNFITICYLFRELSWEWKLGHS